MASSTEGEDPSVASRASAARASVACASVGSASSLDRLLVAVSHPLAMATVARLPVGLEEVLLSTSRVLVPGATATLGAGVALKEPAVVAVSVGSLPAGALESITVGSSSEVRPVPTVDATWEVTIATREGLALAGASKVVSMPLPALPVMAWEASEIVTPDPESSLLALAAAAATAAVARASTGTVDARGVAVGLAALDRAEDALVAAMRELDLALDRRVTGMVAFTWRPVGVMLGCSRISE